MWETLRISEDSTPGQWKKMMTRAMRRKRYDRLPLDADHQSSFAIRMPRKIKIVKLSRKSRKNPPRLVPKPEVEAPPSLWGKARDAYVNMMLKTADTASATSVVPVAKKLDRSLTLGSGFGTKVDVFPSNANLGFKLSKMEQQYLQYLKRTLDGRYA